MRDKEKADRRSNGVVSEKTETARYRKRMKTDSDLERSCHYHYGINGSKSES